MEFNNLKSFLDKFRRIIFQKEELKKIITQIIFEETNYHINEEAILLKDDSIVIKGSPLLRNEILIHKNQILNKLKIIVSERNFNDIK